MKNVKNSKIATALVVVTILSSCQGFIDKNVSPNLTSSNPPSLILSSIEGYLAFTMGSDLLRYSGLWSQQMAAQNGRQTEAYDLYILQPTELNGVWRTNLYAGILADCEEILKKDPATVHPHYFGIAKLIKAFTYTILVDNWGDVPYTQAIQGASGNFTPDVDNGQAIYTAMLALIDDAIVNLNTASSLASVGADDIIYGGSQNIIRWIRFGNTLKLRMYLHLANVSGFDTSVITNFVNNTPATNFMTAIADDFQGRFDVIPQRQNPVHQFILSRTDDICTSATIINLMNSKSDPRRSTYFTPMPFSPALLATPPAGTTGYVGLANGTSNFGLRNNLSRLHTYVRGAVTTTTPPVGPNLAVAGLAYNGGAFINMLTFAEYNFIRAELALRYGVPGVANTFYTAGITASMADAGVSSAAAAYLATPAGTLTGTIQQQLQQIIEEKYVANFMVATEPWSDWRRTGFPQLSQVPLGLNPGNGGSVPRVLLYPQQEVDANPKLTQRTNLSDRKVFWDTRP